MIPFRSDNVCIPALPIFIALFLHAPCSSNCMHIIALSQALIASIEDINVRLEEASDYEDYEKVFLCAGDA